jgi:nucleoside phosphorylase
MEYHDYTVGWICALPTEMAAAEGMLDEEYPNLPRSRHDTNQYTLGKIGEHNVVIACLPSSRYGTISAAVVARDMQSNFPSLRFGLMVGIGGGVPKLPEYDIRLGDVVIGQPTSTNGGVIQYDLGKTVLDGQFMRTGSLNDPPKVLLTAVSKLQARYLRKDHELLKHVAKMVETNPKMGATYTYRNTQNDQLFESSYDHRGSSATCAQCDKSRLVHRGNGARNTPFIHYGLIASGNQVIKDAQTRDYLREKLISERDGEILCFEMEAAGLMNDFPCLVIRGICDYADTHKNKDWQDRAAATAAAYAKELLYMIAPEQVIDTRKVGDVTGNVKTNVMTSVGESLF